MCLNGMAIFLEVMRIILVTVSSPWLNFRMLSLFLGFKKYIIKGKHSPFRKYGK